MYLPLANKLKTQEHIDIATLQDSAIDALYSLIPGIILHGGTAVWRCYGGNRFSEDLDIYIKSAKELDMIRKEFSWSLRKYNITLDKFNTIGNSTVIKLSSGKILLRVDVQIAKISDSVQRTYQKADGSTFKILTLPQHALILEKIKAYESRRYIRDFYDIYILSEEINKKSGVAKKISLFLKDPPRPVNNNVLNSLVYSGLAPKFEDMLSELRGRFS